MGPSPRAIVAKTISVENKLFGSSVGAGAGEPPALPPPLL